MLSIKNSEIIFFKHPNVNTKNELTVNQKQEMLYDKLYDKGFHLSEIHMFLWERLYSKYPFFTMNEIIELNNSVLDEALIEVDFIRPDFSERKGFGFIIKNKRRTGNKFVYDNFIKLAKTGEAENPIKE